MSTKNEAVPGLIGTAVDLGATRTCRLLYIDMSILLVFRNVVSKASERIPGFTFRLVWFVLWLLTKLVRGLTRSRFITFQRICLLAVHRWLLEDTRGSYAVHVNGQGKGFSCPLTWIWRKKLGVLFSSSDPWWRVIMVVLWCFWKWSKDLNCNKFEWSNCRIKMKLVLSAECRTFLCAPFCICWVWFSHLQPWNAI